MNMLQRVEPYVAYGYPNLKTVKVGAGHVRVVCARICDASVCASVCSVYVRILACVRGLARACACICIMSLCMEPHAPPASGITRPSPRPASGGTGGPASPLARGAALTLTHLLAHVCPPPPCRS